MKEKKRHGKSSLKVNLIRLLSLETSELKTIAATRVIALITPIAHLAPHVMKTQTYTTFRIMCMEMSKLVLTESLVDHHKEWLSIRKINNQEM